MNIKLFPVIDIFQKEKKNNNQTHFTAILFTVCAGETLCMLDSVNRTSKPIWSCKLQSHFVYFCRCGSQMHCDTLCCTHNKTVSGESTCRGKLKCFYGRQSSPSCVVPFIVCWSLGGIKTRVGLAESTWHRGHNDNNQVLWSGSNPFNSAVKW